jgi:hypothetical protein
LKDDPPFEPPDDKPIGKWSTDKCKNFLRPRRILLAGKVKELQEQVGENIDVPIPPPVGGPVKEVQAMIISQWEMNSFYMGMDNLPEDDSQKKLEAVSSVYS